MCLHPAGLLNTEEEGFVGTLLSTAQKELNAAFASGDRNSARLLLRFFAALVPSNVLYASSVLKTFKAIVETASEIAEQGKYHVFSTHNHEDSEGQYLLQKHLSEQ